VRLIRMTRRESVTVRSQSFVALRRLAPSLGVILLLGAVGMVSAAKPPKPPVGLAATASVAPTVQYLNDTVGTVFTFSIRNTGTVGIGAIEVARPSTSWIVTACPLAPAGWSTQRSDNFCRYRSASGSADDLVPGSLTSTFQLRATTAPGTADRTGTWSIHVSSSGSFDDPSALKPAPAEAPGLTITAFSFQITDAQVGTGTSGAACPAPTAANHSAITGSTQTILICGRNRMSVADSPTAARSSLAGSFIATSGTFSSALIPANSAVVILGKWTGAQITSIAGPGKSIVTKTGSAVSRNSPLTTFDDVCGASPAFQICIVNGGYEALNQPPDAVDDTANANEDGPAVAIDVLANDSDPDGDPITVTSTGGSPLGLVTTDAGGTGVTYDPNGQFDSLAAGETDTDTFTYTISDGNGGTDTATVTVTITGVNDPPVANDDAAGANEDGPAILVDVLANDTDSDASDTLTINSINSTGTLGSVTNNGTDVTYNPNGQFESLATGEIATDTFTYTVADGNGGIDTATVTVTITGANDGPDAVDDVAGVGEDSTGATIDVLANDTDPDTSDTLGVTAVDTTGTTGTVTNNGTDVTYDPNGQFDGLAAGETDTDTFTYTISDGHGGTDTATVTVTITGVNDPPTAVDDIASTDENTPVSVIAPGVLANDTDPDGDALTPTEMNGSAAAIGVATGIPSGAIVTLNANGSYTYNPNGQFESLAAGETDTDTFTYDISDGNGGTDTATVTVTISGVNDSPTAVDDTSSTPEYADVNIDVLANDTDPDASDTLSVTAVDTTGTLGSVTNNGTDVTYDPNGQFDALEDGETDTDTFTYTVSDGHGGTDTATVTVTINGSTNAPPTALDDVDNANEDGPAVTVNVLANDSDPDAGQTLVVQSVDTTGTLGSVTITNAGADVSYDPNGQFESLGTGGTDTDTFIYTVSDGAGGTDTATVTVTITGANDPPVAVDDVTSTDENTPVSVIAPGVLANDTDDESDALAVSELNGSSAAIGVATAIPSGALVTLNANGSYTYNPNGAFDAVGAGDTDTDTFSYTVSDGNGGSDSATVTITIHGVNDQPIAVDDSGAGFTTDEDTVFTTGDVLANDSDPDGDTLTIPVFDITGTVGLVTYNDDGTFDYDPNGQFDGLGAGESDTDTFTYTISDGHAGSDTATVTITINGVNDPPTAVDDADTTDEDTAKTVDVLANDTDPDTNDTLVVSAVGTPTNGGSVTITNAGADVQFTPGLSFQDLQVGEQRQTTFTYDVSDGNGGTDTATVTMTVTGVNDAPEGTNDSYANAVLNTQVVVGASAPSTPAVSYTGSVLDNDTDVDDLESSLTVTAATFASGDGGSVTIASNGTFTYTPPIADNDPGPADTSDTFTYTVSDTHGGSDTVTVTITFQAQVVWYVKAGGAAGDGRSHNPFNSLAALTTAGASDVRDGVGDIIFVYQGTGDTTGGLVLEGSQKLYGQPHGLTVGAQSLVAAGGSNPNITGGVVLANSAQVLAVNLGNASSSSLSGSGTTVTVGGAGSTNNVAVNNQTGKAIDVSNTTGSMTFVEVISAGSATEGIKLTNVGATFSGGSPTGSITTAAGNDIDIDGGDGNFEYNGSITNTLGRSVEVTNRSSGAANNVSFGGAISDTGTGVNLDNNDVATIAFTNNLTLSTGSNQAFRAVLGGSVYATGTNTIATTTGTALTITDTTIHSNDVSFRSISSNGAVNGVLLNNTGSVGNLVVTGNSAGTCGTAGTEADCTGGTIQASTGDGISLTSTAAPSFTRVNVKNNLGSGIKATGVSALSVSNSRIVNNADTAGISEAGISLTNVTGTSSIASSTVRDSFEDNIHWNISSGSGALGVTSSTVGPTDALGNSGIQIVGTSTGAGTLTVTGSTFASNNSQGVASSMTDSSALALNVGTSTFTDNNIAVAIGVAADADTNFDVNGNTALRSETNAFQVLGGETTTTNSHLVGFIRNNTIGDTTADSGARDLDGIAIELNDDGDGVISILNNVIRHVDQNGIFVQTRDLTAVDGTTNDATLDLHVRDNTIQNIDDNSIVPIGLVYGMLIDARQNTNICLDISSNTSTNIGAQDIRVRQRDASIHRLERFVGNGALDTDVEAFIVGQNDAGTTADATHATSFTGVADGTCRDP
jgi:VCBS repeat-containing protein